MVFETVKENQTLDKSIDLFVKVGTLGFIGVASLLIAKAIFALEWSVSLGM